MNNPNLFSVSSAYSTHEFSFSIQQLNDKVLLMSVYNLNTGMFVNLSLSVEDLDNIQYAVNKAIINIKNIKTDKTN